MQIPWEQLESIPVQTQSGQKLGVIEGVTVENNEHRVVSYEVKPSTILAALFKKPFLIAPSEIISLTNERMIVKDSVAAYEPATNKKQTRLASAPVKSELDI